jgi:hypothetical protein
MRTRCIGPYSLQQKRAAAKHLCQWKSRREIPATKTARNPATDVVLRTLQKGNPEYWNLNGQAFYSTNMTWKQRSTIVNFYHKYFATYVNKQLKEPFPTFMAHLEHGRDYLRCLLNVYARYYQHVDSLKND